MGPSRREGTICELLALRRQRPKIYKKGLPHDLSVSIRLNLIKQRSDLRELKGDRYPLPKG